MHLRVIRENDLKIARVYRALHLHCANAVKTKVFTTNHVSAALDKIDVLRAHRHAEFLSIDYEHKRVKAAAEDLELLSQVADIAEVLWIFYRSENAWTKAIDDLESGPLAELDSQLTIRSQIRLR